MLVKFSEVKRRHTDSPNGAAIRVPSVLQRILRPICVSIKAPVKMSSAIRSPADSASRRGPSDGQVVLPEAFLRARQLRDLRACSEGPKARSDHSPVKVLCIE